MKKVLIYLFAIIGLFTIVGCGSSKSNKTSSNDKKRTYESLLDNFIDGYTKPDIEIVKKIFDLYENDYAYKRMAKILNDEGYRTKVNKKFTKNLKRINWRKRCP